MIAAGTGMGNSLRRQAHGPASLSGRIADDLREQIVTFRLKPYASLSEARLSGALGVSRTPVREALSRLAAQRLVDIYPQRGTIVAPLRIPDLERSQFLRESLEVGLVRRVAALQDRTRLVRQLRTEVALQETFAASGDGDRFFASDEDFHRLIATYAGLPGIWREIEVSKVHMDRCRHLALATVETDIRVITTQHNRIIDAIEQGDAAAAVEATRRHLRRILDFVGRVMEIHPEFFEASGPGDPAAVVEAVGERFTEP